MKKGVQRGDEQRPARRHPLNKPMAFSAAIWLAGALPRLISYRIGEAVACISYLACTSARKSVKANLARVFPEAPSRHLRALTLRTFLNYSRYLVDYFTFSTTDRNAVMEEITRVEGTENIDKALDRGKGIILMTAHLGNWELGGLFFGNKAGIKINILTFRDGINEIDDIKERYRSQYNVNTIVLGDSPFAFIDILNALRRNEIVAMLVDRGGEGGIEVPFFGESTSFPVGPLLLAAQSGAPIIPGFVIREKDGYRARVEDLIYVEKKSGDEVENAARKTIKVFEEYIRKYPDQWYNFVPL